MIRFDKKYVFHIPLDKYENDELVLIDIDDLLNDLIDELGFESLYMTKVKSVYKKRIFDEILITIFTSNGTPEEIFEKWFRHNNGILGQEAFAYELNERMIVKKLK